MADDSLTDEEHALSADLQANRLLVVSPVAPLQSGRPRDELNLIEIGIGFWRRRWLMLSVFLGAIALGVGFAFFRGPVYRYTTVISVGTHLTQRGTDQPIVNLDSDLAAMNSAYLPNAVRHYLNKHKKVSADKLRITAKRSTGSNVIVLSGKSPVSLGKAYLSIERNAADALVQENAQHAELIKAKIQRQLGDAEVGLQGLEDPVRYKADILVRKQALSTAQSNLTALKNEASVLIIRLRNERSLQKIYAESDHTLREHLQISQKDMRSASLKNNNTNSAMTELLLGADMQRNATLLQQLQQKLTARVPDELATLRQEISRNASRQVIAAEAVDEARDNLADLLTAHQRKLHKQKLAVRQLQAVLNNMTSTRLLSPPRRSEVPVGSWTLIVIAGAIFGIIAALFAAGLAAYISAVRAHLSVDS